MSLRFTIEELSEYVEEIFPQIKDDFEILEISEQGSCVRLNVTFKHLFVWLNPLNPTHAPVAGHR